MVTMENRWLLALAAVFVLSTSGNAAGQGAAKGDFCLELTSDILGVNHEVSLNYTEVKNGNAEVYGKSCYTIPLPDPPGGSVSDCAPVEGSAIIQEGRIPQTLERTPMLEIALHAAEHHELFEHATTTTSGTHIWIQNLNDLTGTWAAQSSTSVEDVIVGLFQFDAGTVAAVSCPAKTDEDKEFEKLLKQTLLSLTKQ